MPESRTYVVTRVQRVTVTANSHHAAEIIGLGALDGREPMRRMPGDELWGHVTGPGSPSMVDHFREAATVSVSTDRERP